LPEHLRNQEITYSADADGKVYISGVKSGPYSKREDSWADCDLDTYLDYLDEKARKRKAERAEEESKSEKKRKESEPRDRKRARRSFSTLRITRSSKVRSWSFVQE